MKCPLKVTPARSGTKQRTTYTHPEYLKKVLSLYSGAYDLEANSYIVSQSQKLYQDDNGPGDCAGWC
jgi:hypothetical protein